jgi:hypothetical protein
MDLRSDDKAYGNCRQCNKPFARPGVTCGDSHCQEQEAKENAARAKPRRRAQPFARKAQRFDACVHCGFPLVSHTVAQMQDCANARS